ncbi:teichoic acid biosynthesis protein C [Streptomyces pathocidini]|uniref:phage baseplate protein n=1 Tax=Streptomyces pathocidini TaxID=1650571 RepID=UPI0033C38051
MRRLGDSQNTVGRPSRRSVLGLTGAALAAATLPAPSAAAAARRPGPGQDGKPAAGKPGAGKPTDGKPVTGKPAAGKAAAGKVRFDVSRQGTRWLNGRRLHHTTVMQSFGFDERRRHIYALQVVAGGVQLPGESRTYTHGERAKAGDLCLNKLTSDGTVIGHMYLKGFGHGTAMGVDPDGPSGAVLWTECDANPKSGYGRAIGRFPYVEGLVLRGGDPRLAVYRPLPGSTSNTAAIDLQHRRIMVRYGKPGSLGRFALYDLDAFAHGRFEPLTDFEQPGMDLGLPFQGMTLHGAYAYQMIGSSYDPDSSTPERGNARLYCIDLHTGKVVQEQKSQTGNALQPREPEGLAVLRTAGPKLCMGFASGPVGGRTFAIYYVPPKR